MKQNNKDIDVEEMKKKIMPIYRVAVLGPKGVGKTAIVNQFVNNSFDLLYEETDNDIRKYKKVHDIAQNARDPQYIVYIIEDIFPTNHTDLMRDTDQIKSLVYFGTLENRQQKFKQNNRKNLLDFDKQIYAYIFVYDATDEKKSFSLLEEPIRYISDYCEMKRKYSQLKTKKMLVANKVDLLTQDQKNKLFNKNIMKFLEKFPMDNKYQVSAKTSSNVNLIFEDIGKFIQRDQDLEMVDKGWIKELGTTIQEIENEKKKKQLEAAERAKAKKKKGTKGFLGCGGGNRKDQQDDEDEEEEDVEDDEFANLEVYPGMMDDNQESCSIY